LIDYHLEGGPPKTLNAPAGAYKARDGYVAITTLSDAHYINVCKAIGAGHLIEDPRYRKMADRVDNNQSLREDLEAVLAKDDRAAWVKKLQAAGALADQVNDLGDWMGNEHVRAINAFSMMEQPGLGVIPRPLPAGGSTATNAPSPRQGEHTDDVLAAFGMDAKRIKELRDAGIVG
ncbi:MAG: CoA transferase, partial [Hyphomicrobiaceae bacterium]